MILSLLAASQLIFPAHQLGIHAVIYMHYDTKGQAKSDFWLSVCNDLRPTQRDPVRRF